MKIKVSSVYDFDTHKERKRLRETFSGNVLKRQLNLLDAFAEGNLELVITLYNDLPYDAVYECAEQEYVGKEIKEFLLDLNCGRFQKIDSVLNEKYFFVVPMAI